MQFDSTYISVCYLVPLMNTLRQENISFYLFSHRLPHSAPTPRSDANQKNQETKQSMRIIDNGDTISVHIFETETSSTALSSSSAIAVERELSIHQYSQDSLDRSMDIQKQK